ncbi:MAG TPA: hypothetical protein VMQ93_01755 [Novosphingobium sp.]|nr:hypothetical protein [Novosphingobium sp.]
MLGEMPPMLSSMMKVLFAGVEAVEVVEPGEGGQAVPLQGIDVLLLRAADLAECEALLGEIARAAPVGVVAISESGQRGTAYRLSREPVAVSAEGRLDLVGAIRVAAGQAPDGEALH